MKLFIICVGVLLVLLFLVAIVMYMFDVLLDVGCSSEIVCNRCGLPIELVDDDNSFDKRCKRCGTFDY